MLRQQQSSHSSATEVLLHEGNGSSDHVQCSMACFGQQCCVLPVGSGLQTTEKVSDTVMIGHAEHYLSSEM